MTSRFVNIKPAPPIEVFALRKSYLDDPSPQKVDLGIGAYRDNSAKPWVLPVVRKVEKELANDETLNHEYLSQTGHDGFTKAATNIVLGEDSPAIREGRVVRAQALSGSGALRVGADFLNRVCKYTTYYYSDPTWGAHKLIFNHAGFTNSKTYRYWDGNSKGLDINGMLEDLKNAPEDSVIILHACAHNPTGVDPTDEQWKQIADVMEEKKLFPFFDCAYQGFASGDLERDSKAIRYFVSRGFEMLCSQSFAKNFGLYDQRIGNLTIVLKDTSAVAAVQSQLAIIIRGNYSNPPSQGARIVHRVLTDPDLFVEWKGHIKEMAERIINMRAALRSKLEEIGGTPGAWEHITSQIGMFSYTGLTVGQVKYLIKEHHIYLLDSGRISMCGLNTSNIDYVANAINEAISKVPN